MAEKKIVSAKSTSNNKSVPDKSKGIDLSELKKIGAAILAFIVANPEIISKLLAKPAAYLKKVVNGEDVSTSTKKKVNKTIDDNKSGGVTSILTSLAGLSGGDKETNSIFDNISGTLSSAKSSGIDVGSLIGNVLGSSKTTKRKTTKKSSSSDVLGSVLKGLFK